MELSLISSFCIYGNIRSENLILLAKVVRVTLDGGVAFYVFPLSQ